ncbi:MAG: Uma2 family endonuclease [Thermosynechococcaceae cyanobacterium]
MAAEQRLTLNDVSWKTYEHLLDIFGEHRTVRFHYDQGVLELMVPLQAHESPSDLTGLFICTLVVESGMNLKCLASTTLRQRKLAKGAEPDKCYYIQNEPLVRGRTVDLETDPPPDLVVEIDITHTDIDKNALYASMKVPEFWRFNGSILTIYQLQQDQYQEVEISPTFPWVSKELFYHFFKQGKKIGEAQAIRELKAWVLQQNDSSASV